MSVTESANATGADRLLDHPGLTIERMPMLTVIFDRMAASCAEGMRPLSPAVMTFFVNNIGTDHVWDVLDAYDGSIAAILYTPELDARFVVGLDRRCIFALMEVLFGGDATEAPFGDDRGFSNLETRVAQTIFEIASEALKSAFSNVVETTFVLERIETRMDFTMLGRRNILAVVAKILIQALDVGGQMFVIIPQQALIPIRQKLTRDLTGDGTTSDPRWVKQLQNGLKRTEIVATGILDELTMTLGDIAALRVGDMLHLKASALSKVKLESRGQPLFFCQLGQANGVYTLCINERAEHEEEPWEVLLNMNQGQ